MPDLLRDLLFDYTLRNVALGTATIGIVSGVLGCFALLRRQSLLGDAISHAALPGVVVAFLLTRSREPLVLILGAAVAGWLATLLIGAVTRNTRLKEDTALGLALSIFFGLGIMLLTYTQRLSDARQAGLDRFLFGQAAALIQRDVITIAVIGLLALAVTVLLWKEFKLLAFDPAFAASLGFRVRALDITLTTLLVIAIVIGLQSVGVILMSAMVVAPAAAARQWTNRLSVMALLAAIFGAVSGISGALISSTASGLATGPVIVLIASAITLVSLALAPARGLLWSWLRQQRNRRRLRVQTVLADLYALDLQHDDPAHGHTIAVLHAMNAGRGGVAITLQQLVDDGLAQEVTSGEWALTEAGRARVERLLATNGSEEPSPVRLDVPAFDEGLMRKS